MTTESQPLHPRPQLTRDRWTDLRGPWGFAHDDADVGLQDGWFTREDVFDRTITVPFPPESAASGIHDPAFHPVVWYRRTFRVEAGSRWLLHFGAVDYAAKVWVNGQLVAQHEGGHTPFTADVTHALNPGDAEQVVVVRAQDEPLDLTQPRGKQYWEPRPGRIWYHRTTGIWQPVWLEPVPETFVRDLWWTSDADRGTLGLHLRLNRPGEGLRLRVRLSIRGRVLADDTYGVEGAEVRRTVTLDPNFVTRRRSRTLWSPRYPNLIDAELQVLRGEEVVDSVRSYAGLRSVEVRDGRFHLNGGPYFLRLVLAQGYWPESHLAAPSDDALRREVELIKALGFNGVRIHQKVEDPRFLYWCDRLGVLVWGEMANAYTFTEEAVERLTREWMEVVRRDRSHPSIVTWVPLNESWGVPHLERDPAQQAHVQAMYHLTRSLDPSRPVIGNDGWEYVAGDIVGIHDYAFDGATIRERYGSPEAVERTMGAVRPHYRKLMLRESDKGAPLMLTECGGFSLAPSSGEQWWGYATATDSETYLAKYRDLMDAILASTALAGYCYTQLTDTEQETNGLLAADRTPKLDPEEIRRVTARPSAAVPGEQLTELQVAADPNPPGEEEGGALELG